MLQITLILKVTRQKYLQDIAKVTLSIICDIQFPPTF